MRIHFCSNIVTTRPSVRPYAIEGCCNRSTLLFYAPPRYYVKPRESLNSSATHDSHVYCLRVASGLRQSQGVVISTWPDGRRSWLIDGECRLGLLEGFHHGRSSALHIKHSASGRAGHTRSTTAYKISAPDAVFSLGNPATFAEAKHPLGISISRRCPNSVDLFVTAGEQACGSGKDDRVEQTADRRDTIDTIGLPKRPGAQWRVTLIAAPLVASARFVPCPCYARRLDRPPRAVTAVSRSSGMPVTTSMATVAAPTAAIRQPYHSSCSPASVSKTRRISILPEAG